ncbi:uncharacterized protein METZ01_LOCUS424917 [marine metagenome]|uniref:Uncharacterized protein n=1 Tax=marine metagenome TaxID=408172 RepID=A0A382XM77_9ZZZZ
MPTCWNKHRWWIVSVISESPFRSITERVEVVTSVAVLLIPDIGEFALEFSQAYILTNGRLVLGVVRGDLIDPH